MENGPRAPPRERFFTYIGLVLAGIVDCREDKMLCQMFREYPCIPGLPPSLGGRGAS